LICPDFCRIPAFLLDLCGSIQAGYAATTSFALAAAALAFSMNGAWLGPLLTALSVAYFLGGVALRLKHFQLWADVLRFSGLALGVAAVAAVVRTVPAGAGWYVLGVSLLYTLELYLNKNTWAELGVLSCRWLSDHPANGTCVR
jgi:hypothetical protein